MNSACSRASATYFANGKMHEGRRKITLRAEGDAEGHYCSYTFVCWSRDVGLGWCVNTGDVDMLL